MSILKEFNSLLCKLNSDTATDFTIEDIQRLRELNGAIDSKYNTMSANDIELLKKIEEQLLIEVEGDTILDIVQNIDGLKYQDDVNNSQVTEIKMYSGGINSP